MPSTEEIAFERWRLPDGTLRNPIEFFKEGGSGCYHTEYSDHLKERTYLAKNFDQKYPRACPDCDKPLLSVEDWKNHIIHAEQMYKCNVCCYSFGTRQMRWRHHDQIHVNHLKYQCENCLQCSYSKSNIDVHFKICGDSKRWKVTGSLDRKRKLNAAKFARSAKRVAAMKSG